MAKSRDSVLVSVDPDILDTGAILVALVWSGAIIVDDWADTKEAFILAQKQQKGGILLRASKFEPDHHFGPVITIGSGAKMAEIMIPWQRILAVIKGVTEQEAIGFASGHAHMGQSLQEMMKK
jgi:hypothetical protein